MYYCFPFNRLAQYTGANHERNFGGDLWEDKYNLKLNLLWEIEVRNFKYIF